MPETYNNELRTYIKQKCKNILEGFKLIYIDYEYNYHWGYAPILLMIMK